MAEPLRTLRVEVVHALPQRQLLVVVEVASGTTIGAAVGLAFARAELAAAATGFDPATAEYGLFGKRVPASQSLRDGDRIEVLRPLLADPKEVRRALATQGRTMGRPATGPKD